MKTIHRLLMAGTVLSGVVSIQVAEAGIASGAPAQDKAALASSIQLAQAEPVKKPEDAKKLEDAKKKLEDAKKPAPPKRPPAPPAAPAPRPVAPPAAAPRPAPPPAVQTPARPPAPPAAQPVRPPAVQAPARPQTPPAAPSPPRVAPPAAQERPPAAPGRPVTPPAVQTQPPPGAGRPVTPPPAVQPARPPAPPAAQGVPPATPPAAQSPPRAAPPAAQGQPPAVPGRRVTPPAAQTQPPADAGRPVTPPPAAQTPARPPAAQGVPPVAPPAAQGQPPAVSGRPVTPPAAPAGAAQPAGVAPNLQRAPLQRSGVPAPTAEQARPIAPAAPGAGLAPQSAQGQPLRRIDDLRRERRQTTVGKRTIIREPDRTIIREGGQTVIRHNEVNRFRYGARDVRQERRGNDNATIVMRSDGSRIVTVLDSNGFLLRRSRIMTDGREIIIIDNRPRGASFRRGGGYGGFFINLAPPVIRIPRDRYIVDDDRASAVLLYETLIAEPIDRIERAYSLDEIRYTAPLRDRMPRIDLNTVTFDTGSWELTPGQVEKLAAIAEGLNRAIERNPREVFLIEGHTDAVGTDEDNLSLSDRRAESVAIALTQQFDVPPENLTTQGYGEQYLKIPTGGPERANRRVTVRRITPLLTGQAR